MLDTDLTAAFERYSMRDRRPVHLQVRDTVATTERTLTWLNILI